MRRALVVGRADGVYEEYAAVLRLFTPDDILLVGSTGIAFPDRIDHWVSFHSNCFDRWTDERARRGLPAARHFWGGMYKKRPLAPRTRHPIQYIECNGGSSGLMAVLVAVRKLRADRTVLVGVPMDAAACKIDTPREPWAEADQYWPAWKEHEALLLGRVRSLSGRTKDMLGAPDVAWLSSG